MRTGDPSIAARVHVLLRGAFATVCAGLPGARVDAGPDYTLFICPPLPLPQFNGVWADQDGGACVEDLSEAVAEVERLGLQFWLQTREGRHPLVEQEAGRLGLELVEETPGMAVAASDLARPLASGIRIERVTDASGLTQVGQVADVGFGAPPGTFSPLCDERLAATPGVSYYLGLVGDEPVATALGLLRVGAIGVFNVTTLPRYRGRGYGADLSARVVIDGLAQGADLAVLQASAMGEPVYRRLGFRRVQTYRLFTRGSPGRGQDRARRGATRTGHSLMLE